MITVICNLLLIFLIFSLLVFWLILFYAFIVLDNCARYLWRVVDSYGDSTSVEVLLDLLIELEFNLMVPSEIYCDLFSFLTTLLHSLYDILDSLCTDITIVQVKLYTD